MTDDLSRFPILGPRERGSRVHHEVGLPGPALAGERWTVTSITGARPGPALLVSAGIHGAEYPAIQAAIETSASLDPATLRGTVVVVPVVSLPMFRERAMFTMPQDGKNPNRFYPGTPDGTYSEQLAWAFTTQFIDQADAYVDLHGGDMVEALEPFSICSGGETEAHRKSFEYAKAFGLPWLLVTTRPVQPSPGTTTNAAAVARGIPSFIAEAGGIGLLEAEPTALLVTGIRRLLGHLEMIGDAPPPPEVEPAVLSKFEWLYTPTAGMFYPTVAVSSEVQAGDVVGTIGSLTGQQLDEIRSPVTGRVLFLTTSPAMKENGLLMGIGVR
ncbi:MAG: succinylglutamate desuccinylase [Chloroflexi bacterium]|nr:MAG: succinylglutamate desuccinylase [Chloroflexota bacterium]